MRYLLILLIVLLLCYIAAAAWLYLKQRSLLYFPSPAVETDYEQMTVQNEKEHIHITITNPGESHALLYWGGNGEAVATGAEVFAKALPHYSTYLIDYRGYGRSSGTPTESGIFSDALLIYDTIKAKHQDISLFGRSLGTGVACYVASRRPTDKLVLITPYDSIESVARDRYPIFPLSLLIQDKYDSLRRVSQIKADTIILIAENDTVVPKKHAYILAEAFPKDQIRTYEIKGSHHNDIADTAEYSTILKAFLKEKNEQR